MRKIKTRSTSLDDTKNVAHKILNRELKKKRKNALVFSLSGPLGVGKTAFVKSAASFFGIPKKNITSPTFVIFKRYVTKKNKEIFSHFYHADAYRIKNHKELDILGFGNITENQNAIVFVEWGERVEKILPKDTINVHIAYGENKKERFITTQ